MLPCLRSFLSRFHIKKSSAVQAVLVLLLSLQISLSVSAQPADIREETRMIKTYPFSEPDPVPILTENPKIYPYHRFLGYSQEGREQPWKVVVLENDYIQVFVLPQSGGKVWGAIEKSTGEEFIYRNEVMKFRNIAMRGPWTSGGIEFNFGIIGHAPSTATPVDYVLEEHEDGSVSCTVGTMDLPSRTHWRVTITLPADKAYFTTQSLWYNPTPQHQAYYNWMTAAARASSDLELIYPGNAYLGHPGDLHPWPIDREGRNLVLYRNNNFGGSKSYHVVGRYHNFFGGYWHDRDFGFGHWARHDDMPGQKLWIWALSRSGGIWEDLLTDTDGQYIEFQAGRLLNQYSYSTERNPISEVAFGPYVTDQWKELWFPIREIGGISAVTPFGAIRVDEQDSEINLGFNAFQQVQDTLQVTSGDQVLFQQPLSLNPMEVWKASVPKPQANESYQISLKEGGRLFSSNDSQAQQLSRPFADSSGIALTEARQLYQEGYQLFNNRSYEAAQQKLEACLQREPGFRPARIILAELLYHNAQYHPALRQINLALQADAYDADANYVAAIIYRALGRSVDALEALGWAARSMMYRSAAYAQMAEIYLQTQIYDEAEYYATRALDFNRLNIGALQVLAVVYRKGSRPEEAQRILETLTNLDPLHHFAHFERYLANPHPESLQNFSSHIANEFPEQTYLEIALDYLKLGQLPEARAVLKQAPQQPLLGLWQAYLNRVNTKESRLHLTEALAQSPDFVFPYRPETLPVLEWALTQHDHWKLRYYLGLNYWALNQPDKAIEQFNVCGDQPDAAAFYLSRAALREKEGEAAASSDMEKALSLGKEQWPVWHRYLRYLNSQAQPQEQLEQASRAHELFPDNYVIGMDYAQALFNSEKYQKSIDVLTKLQVLPYEGASEGRVIYEKAHIYRALEQIRQKQYRKAISTLQASLEWPENLGVGQPYHPDNTRQDYLIAYCYQQLGQAPESEAYLRQVVAYSEQQERVTVNELLALHALKKLRQDDELSDHLRLLERSDNPPAEWVLAVWQNGGQGQQPIAEELTNAPELTLEIYQMASATP